MGTRNLTAVFYNGEYRIAQYGQWDGYPDGQGVTALEFARDKHDREVFLGKLMKLKTFTKEDGDRLDAEVGERWPKVYPHLSRDAGAKILGMVQDGPEGMLIKPYIDFAGASLFCEWGYVLDFDKDTFEAYRGFNKEPLDPSERFASIKTEHDDYKQIKLVKSWPLDALPTNEQFVKDLDPPDEEDAAA